MGLTLPPSCADSLEIWETQSPGTRNAVQECNGFALPLHIANLTLGTLRASQGAVAFRRTTDPNSDTDCRSKVAPAVMILGFKAASGGFSHVGVWRGSLGPIE